MRKLTCIVAALLITGCAATQQGATERLAGMSRGDFLACAGVPNGAARDGDREFLTYTSMNSEGRTFRTKVILRANTVESVTCAPRTWFGLDIPPACGAVGACLK